jgi:hypothetical protein
MSFDKATAAELLSDDSTFAFTLMTILLAEYGQDVFDENPVALFNRIEEDFRIKLPEDAENRINAALTAMTTDLFYTQFSAFKSIALALTEGDIGAIADDEEEEEELNAAEILWAIVEVGLLNGEDFNATQEQLSESVAAGCNAIIDSEAEDEVDDVDTVQDAMQEPYYQKFVTLNLLALVEQLAKLKVPMSILESLLGTYNRTFNEAI